MIALQVVVGRDGSISSMRALNGPDILAQAAMDALRWWKFEPYRINGEPAPVETTLAIEFKRSVIPCASRAAPQSHLPQNKSLPRAQMPASLAGRDAKDRQISRSLRKRSRRCSATTAYERMRANACEAGVAEPGLQSRLRPPQPWQSGSKTRDGWCRAQPAPARRAVIPRQ